jgi:hypothetical protein
MMISLSIQEEAPTFSLPQNLQMATFTPLVVNGLYESTTGSEFNLPFGETHLRPR